MGSKYSELKNYLTNQQSEIVCLSFAEIEKLIGTELPTSAKGRNEWWSSSGHSHAQTWEKSGYKAINVGRNRQVKRMQFARISKTRPNKQIIKRESTIFDIEKVDINEELSVREIEQNISTNKTFKTISNSEDINISDDKIYVEGYSFVKTAFSFYERNIPSPFLQYRGRTVADMIKRKHYSSLGSIIKDKYNQFLNSDIQHFMTYLVNNNDDFYRRFLNKDGNSVFCKFNLTDRTVYNKRGLYLYMLNGEITYIGRCRDSFGKRFGVNGYGKIAPINC